MNLTFKSLSTLFILALGVFIGASALQAVAYTWTAPSGGPGTTNVAPPINVGVNGVSNLQEKFDSLQIDGNLGILGSFVVSTGTTPLIANSTKGKVLTAIDDSGTAAWMTGGEGGSGLAFGIKNDTNNDGSPDAVAFNTIYHAQTDGIVYASIHYGSNWPDMKAYTDSNPTPTTMVIDEGPDDDGGNSSMSFPVKKGDYWEVAVNGSYNTSNINWMPVVPVNAATQMIVQNTNTTVTGSGVVGGGCYSTSFAYGSDYTISNAVYASWGNASTVHSTIATAATTDNNSTACTCPTGYTSRITGQEISSGQTGGNGKYITGSGTYRPAFDVAFECVAN